MLSFYQNFELVKHEMSIASKSTKIDPSKQKYILYKYILYKYILYNINKYIYEIHLFIEWMML